MRFIQRRQKLAKKLDLKNTAFFFLKLSAFFGSLFWGLFEGGFEPWIVAAITLAALLYPIGNIRNFFSRGPRLTPEERVAARDRLRPVFDQYFREMAAKDYQGDAIIHDISRLDEYPEIDEHADGISSWFRIGLMGMRADCILVGLRFAYVVEHNGVLKEVRKKDHDGAENVLLVGEIPFESIESVNFDGDDYYNTPHIFCHFEHASEPYRRLFYGKEFRLFDGAPWHYNEVGKYQPDG